MEDQYPLGNIVDLSGWLRPHPLELPLLQLHCINGVVHNCVATAAAWLNCPTKYDWSWNFVGWYTFM